VRSVTFAKALECTTGARRHLLLGNGFSMAFTRSFGYPSLFSVAGAFSPAVAALFNPEEPDFEAALNLIAERRRAAAAPPVLVELNRQEAEVKRAFARALGKVHPASSMSATAEQKEACVAFLRHFHDAKVPRDRQGKIFTTNYDLLLSWVMAASGKQLKCYDDFIADPYDVEFRPWDQDKVPDLVYLHGALNIFRHERRLAMLRYRLGARLVDQINDRLRANEFPVLVAEGSSPQKADRIDANPYLAKAFDTYRRALNDPTSVLFTFGHSLNAVDAHLLRVLGRRKLRGIYIGAFGGVDSPDGARAQRWASEWQEQRPGLDVAVYNSKECAVWKAG